MKLFRLFLFVFCVQFFAISAFAKERIERFDVNIVAEQNGDLLVTETITVTVEGRVIKRGIFRELPRYQLDNQGHKIPVRYKIRDVDRNNESETYEVERDGNAVILRIGDPDRRLPKTSHTYEITYLVKDELRREDGFDEIYWNVTGDKSIFEIAASKATVTVPDGAQYITHKVFTGPTGATGRDARFYEKDGQFIFETTKALPPKHGMTIALQFEKGVFGPVQEGTKRYIWWLRNGALILLSLSFLGIALYYYVTWNRVGRDPAKGAVFAHYEPPKGYSPAAASYIYYRGLSGHKALSATLMGLATKNWLSIDADKRKTVLMPLDRDVDYKEEHSAIDMTMAGFKAIMTGDWKALREEGLEAYMQKDEDVDIPDDTVADRGNLNGEEKQLFGRLFPGSRLSPVTLKREVNTHFNLAHAAFRRNLKRDYGEPYHNFNAGYIILGVVASVIAIVVTLSQISSLTPMLIYAGIAGLVILNFLFFYLMPAPTKKGQKVRTEIEGFRLYMKTAEKQRFDAVEVGADQPPPMSVERYEALLPYAIALDVEEPWSRHFENVMPLEAKNYDPHWSGSRSYSSLSQMNENLVSGISAGVSNAAPQSSGSSGGGGGGFSGGGGGGGGVGGW